MQNFGISIYPGLDNTFEENLELLADAHDAGASRIFTSFHIPETDPVMFHNEVHTLLEKAREYDLDVISDVSPASLEVLGIDGLDMPKLKKLGITTLRIDYGYTAEDIAELSHNRLGIKLQLNASATTDEFLQELMDNGANFRNIDALHNFYPRENTGLSEEFFLMKTRRLQELGIQVGAFIPSMNRPRSPIGAGLPTLELHRETGIDFAARHMVAMGVDFVIIGDSMPTYTEVEYLSQIPDDGITLKINIQPANPNVVNPLITAQSKIPYFESFEISSVDAALEKKLINAPYFTTRPDEARDVFRTNESRAYFKSISIEPNDTPLPRLAGTITLDSDLYGRYKGELQITKRDLPADKRVRVIGRLSVNDLLLLKYLLPNSKVYFTP